MSKTTLTELQEKLDYKFIEPKLLQLALTHKSFSTQNNERLEFLGDSALGIVISDYLYSKYPDTREGLLSRVRSKIVSKETLIKLGLSIRLDEYIRVGTSENKDIWRQPSYKSSIVSNALEAIFGAIYVDGGYEKVRFAILNLFREDLASIDINRLYKDHKTRLQELVQSAYHSIPSYAIKSEKSYSKDMREFLISCTVPNHTQKFLGKGTSRKEAEQNAAKEALDILSDKLN